MFLGTVPQKCIEQILALYDFAEWGSVYVCCSGTFRIEEAIHSKHPEIPIFGNDVSLYSSVIGGVLTEQPFPIRFAGALGFIEERLGDCGFLDRAAATLVARDLARFHGDNDYHRRHFAHYVDRFADFHAKARERLIEKRDKIKLNGYFAGDWREHVRRAIEQGAGIAAFPPFFKGDYESQYRFLDKNITWPAPAYDIYDPKRLGEIVDWIDESGVPYFVITDQVLEGHEPCLEYQTGRKVPHYGYGRTERSSVRHFGVKSVPFRYTAVDPLKLHEKTVLRVTTADYTHVNYLKDIYLQKTIRHTDGMIHFFVFLDDMLAGALVFSRSRFSVYGPGAIYLLSDVTTTRAAKVSKLIALVATSETVLKVIGRQLFMRVDQVVTTARTSKPSSMKYRGVYEMLSRKPPSDGGTENVINYGSAPRRESLKALYRMWWDKWGRKEVQKLQAREAL